MEQRHVALSSSSSSCVAGAALQFRGLASRSCSVAATVPRSPCDTAVHTMHAGSNFLQKRWRFETDPLLRTNYSLCLPLLNFPICHLKHLLLTFISSPATPRAFPSARQVPNLSFCCTATLTPSAPAPWPWLRCCPSPRWLGDASRDSSCCWLSSPAWKAHVVLLLKMCMHSQASHLLCCCRCSWVRGRRR